MRSSVAAFKAGLKTRLAAAITGPDLLVSLGVPDLDIADLVAIADAAIEPLQYRGGMTQAIESYTLTVLVSSVRAKVTAPEVVASAAADLAEKVSDSITSWKDSAFDGLADTVKEGAKEAGDLTGATARESYVEMTFEVSKVIT